MLAKNDMAHRMIHPSSGRWFYGWSVLIVAAAAMVGTLPGRTQGLGLITEPLLADLGMSRTSYATINLWATLIGAGGALGVGRLIDRFGARRVLAILAVTLGAVVCAMSQTRAAVSLAVWLTLTRTLGQSALSVVSLAMVGQWFVRRIDVAMAVYSVVLSVGFMAAFPLVGASVQAWGWRTTWFAVGAALIIGLAPLAWLVVRRSPEAMGLAPDGEVPNGLAAARAAALSCTESDALPGYSWNEALATPAFWVFAIGAALYGLVASGVGLFNESILAERGFGPTIYYQTLAVTAMTGLAGNFAGGRLAGRMRLGRLLAVSLAVLSVGLLALPHVTAVWHVFAWASAMGLGGGLVMVLFFSVWPRVYGRRHLGQIQGAAQALTVVASAVGPWLLAWWVETNGSYAAMFRMLASAIAAVSFGALLVSAPDFARRATAVAPL